MCCKGRLGALALALLMAGCGRKEPPQPPPSRVPAPVANLSVQQRGMELLMRMAYPTVTLGGLPIDELEAVEIWQMKRILTSMSATPEGDAEAELGEKDEGPGGLPEADTPTTVSSDAAAAPPEEAEEPEEIGLLLRLPADAGETEPKESLVTVDSREFEALAQPVWTLRGSELSSAVLGDTLLVRLPIAEIPSEEEVLVFAARAVAGRRLASPFSNTAKLLLRQPPPPPASFALEAQSRGVEISWLGADDVKGYRVYRRSANVRDYGPPIYSASADGERYLDTAAQFGQRYIYTVTSVASTLPLLESAIAAEREVDFQDRFPPAPPGQLIALPEPGRVRLLWEPSADDDVIGYRVHRQETGEPFRLITREPIVGTEFLDRDLAAGQIYRYYLIAEDGEGNQSEASSEIEARVP